VQPDDVGVDAHSVRPDPEPRAKLLDQAVHREAKKK
jgi:hypothetical protein